MINETSAVPPPPPAAKKFPAPAPAKPPVVTPTGPEGAFLVELMMYNGSPFKNHWAYWVSSHMSPEIGVAMDAAGDVRSGFEFQIRRCPDLSDSSNQPWKRVPLQWVDGKHFDETKMLNGEEFKVDTVPVCGFEASAHKVEVPEKSLNSVEEMVRSRLTFLSVIYAGLSTNPAICFPGGYKQCWQEDLTAELSDVDRRIRRPAR